MVALAEQLFFAAHSSAGGLTLSVPTPTGNLPSDEDGLKLLKWINTHFKSELELEQITMTPVAEGDHGKYRIILLNEGALVPPLPTNILAKIEIHR